MTTNNMDDFNKDEQDDINQPIDEDDEPINPEPVQGDEEIDPADRALREAQEEARTNLAGWQRAQAAQET